MLEPTTITYQNVDNKKSLNLKSKSNKIFYLYNIFGFFLSMASPYGNMTPFGLVFLTLEKSFKKSTVFAFFAVVIGSLMLESKLLSAKYIAAEIIYFSILFVLEKGVKISFFASVGSAVVSLLLSGIIIMYWQGLTLYTVFELILELLLTAVGVFVFNKSKNILTDKNVNFENLNTGNRVCLCVVSALLLLSLKKFFIGNSISIINIAAATLLMCIGTGTSAAVTAAAGVILGMLCGIETDYFLPLIGAFGFCGFLTGIFSKFGKGGTAVGLILANAVLTVYTNNAIEPMLKIYEILLSIVVLIFIPDTFIQKTKYVVLLKNSDKEGIARFKESMKQKLKSVSESFYSMAKAIENLSVVKEENEISDAETIFDNAADKVCVNCKKSPVCWGKNFNKTYREFFSVLKILESNGSIVSEDLSDALKNNCINIDKLLEELSVQYDSHRMKKIWKGKLEESRELAGQQLIGMSKILDEMAGNLDVKSEIVTSDRVRKELESKCFKIKSLDVLEDKTGKVKVSFIIKKVSLKNGGEGRILRCLKNVFSREIQISVYETSKDGYVRINAYETEKYTVEKGFACASFDKSSGDNFGFYKLSSGKYVITLSDGMGTGDSASKESRAVIELMDSFLRAGFDKKIAIKLINSVLLLKSDNQSFATIDMCIIDLYTGIAEFLKTGAEPSYIKKDAEVLSVSGSSLPIGITSKAEPEMFCCNLTDGDVIVWQQMVCRQKKVVIVG